jgi:hypothetical protein
MWYHFAFVAISLALFGMTVGAVLVFVPGAFKPARAAQMALYAVGCGDDPV